MNTAAVAVWQTIRLALHPSASSRAAFSTLRTAVGASRQSKQLQRCISSNCGSPWGSYDTLRSCRYFKPTRATRPVSPGLAKQWRWVSLWRTSHVEKETHSGASAENEISISPSEVEGIFGQKMDPEKGVEILMALQKHRLEGTLDHKMPYSNMLVAKGLRWLRKKNPLDEDAAIMARIDREIIGTRTPQTDVERSRQAVSQFERMREEQKKRNKVEEKERDVEEQKRSRESSRETSKKIEVKSKSQTSPSIELVGLRPEPEWVRNYREKATNRDESVKLLSTWQRLLPSAAMTITIVGLSVLFAANYTPPSRSARIWPEMPPAAATISAIIGINCAVFICWRIPPLWKFMNRYFLVAPVYPYSMSMLGAAFSHQHFSHLLGNCLFLWLVGTRVHDDIGRGPFLAAYLSCAVIGAFIPMAVYALRKNLVATTLGASSAVCGMIAVGCVLREGTTVVLPFIPPEWSRGVDTGLLLVLLVLSEIVAIRRWGITPSLNPGSVRPPVDNMGHLAGYAAGIGAGAAIRSSHPEWKNKKREHFLTKGFGRGKEPPSPRKSPPE